MATPKWYPSGLVKVMDGTLDLDVASGYKLMLVTSSYTPAQSTHDFRDDIGANEASGGSGYTAGGFTLASLSVVQATLVANWDAADISQAITGGPFAFRYGVYYRARGGASSADELVGYVDFGAQSVTDATINITQTNMLTITAS
jgi:hypothetical protein